MRAHAKVSAFAGCWCSLNRHQGAHWAAAGQHKQCVPRLASMWTLAERRKRLMSLPREGIVDRRLELEGYNLCEKSPERRSPTPERASTKASGQRQVPRHHQGQ